MPKIEGPCPDCGRHHYRDSNSICIVMNSTPITTKARKLKSTWTVGWSESEPGVFDIRLLDEDKMTFKEKISRRMKKIGYEE